MGLKKTEITEKVKESVGQNGNNPQLFGEIVKAAIALLECLIAKVLEKVKNFAEKVIDKTVDAAKEMKKESEKQVHAKDEPMVQAERKKIPVPVNLHRESNMKKNTEHPATASTEKESIVKQIKAEQKPVSIETVQTAERPPQPKMSILASKYPRLKEIEGRLKEQNKAIFGRERKRDKLKKELSECTSIFKGGRRKELQQEIDSLGIQISNMKKRLSSIVNEHHFDSVQAFYKELNAAKKEYLDYQASCVEYEQACGDKVPDTMSIRDRLRQKEQVVKIREAGRDDRTRHKDRGAR